MYYQVQNKYWFFKMLLFTKDQSGLWSKCSKCLEKNKKIKSRGSDVNLSQRSAAQHNNCSFLFLHSVVSDGLAPEQWGNGRIRFQEIMRSEPRKIQSGLPPKMIFQFSAWGWASSPSYWLRECRVLAPQYGLSPNCPKAENVLEWEGGWNCK